MTELSEIEKKLLEAYRRRDALAKQGHHIEMEISVTNQSIAQLELEAKTFKSQAHASNPNTSD